MWQMIQAICFADEYFKMAQYVNQIGEEQGKTHSTLFFILFLFILFYFNLLKILLLILRLTVMKNIF